MTDSPALSNPEDDQPSDTEDDDKDRNDIKKSLAHDRPETPEWMDSTQHLVSEAQQIKVVAAVLREESNELRAQLDRQVHDTTRTVNEQLKKKIADAIALQGKLGKRVTSLTGEFEGLQRLRQAAAKQLQAREGPLHIAEKRVRLRSQRPQREQIYDSVERALQTEYKDLRNAVDQLTAAVEAADGHLSKIEQMERHLQTDIEDKNVAVQLDQDCLDLVLNPDKPLRLAASIPKLETTEPPRKSQGLPELWKKDTDSLLDEAMKLEQMAVRMKKNLKALITQIQDANLQSNNLSNTALKKKVSQGTKLYAQLNTHLQEITEEMEQLDLTKQQLNAALRQREKPLAVVQRRLAIRQQRPQREAIRDGVEEALESELQVLTQNVQSIQNKISAVDNEFKRLQKAKNQLADDLQDKAQSLKLDKSCLEVFASENEAIAMAQSPNSPANHLGGPAALPPVPPRGGGNSGYSPRRPLPGQRAGPRPSPRR